MHSHRLLNRFPHFAGWSAFAAAEAVVALVLGGKAFLSFFLSSSSVPSFSGESVVFLWTRGISYFSFTRSLFFNLTFESTRFGRDVGKRKRIFGSESFCD